MTGEVRIEKRGYPMPLSQELAESLNLGMSGFPRKGHYVEIPLTDEDRELHARAVALYEELQSNPWIRQGGYDSELEVLPLEPEHRFIPEETHEEHMARWTAAGRPDLNRDALHQKIMRSYAAGLVTPDQARGSAFIQTGAS
jgi:hypothetical protein